MNKNIFLILVKIFFFGRFCFSSTCVFEFQDYKPYHDEERNGWGYKDAFGKVVIEPRFGGAMPFQDGRARVASKDGMWGVIDATGTLVVQPKYHEISEFCKGFAEVQVGSNFQPAHKIKKGIINMAGREVVKPKFLHVEACPVKEGWFKVRPHGAIHFYSDWWYASADGKVSKNLPESKPDQKPADPYEVKYKKDLLILEDKKLKIKKEIKVPVSYGHEIVGTYWISDKLLRISTKYPILESKEPEYFFYKTDLDNGAGGLLKISGVVMKVEKYDLVSQLHKIILNRKYVIDLEGNYLGVFFQDYFFTMGSYQGFAYKHYRNQGQELIDTVVEFFHRNGRVFNVKYSDWNMFPKDHVLQIHNGTITFYKASEGRPVAQYGFYDNFTLKYKMSGIWSKFNSLMYEINAYPVRTENDAWAFSSFEGVLQGQSVKADLLFPIVHSGGPYLHNGKWGFIRKDGSVIVPAMYDSLTFENNNYYVFDLKKNKKYYLDESGQLQEATTNASNPVPQRSESPGTCTCLIYKFKNSSRSYDNEAYILVDICYYKNRADHEAMSRWVRNAIGSEIQALWREGYYPVNDTWNNVYQADLLGDGSCYHYQTEFKMKSSKVSAFQKNFFD
ncbi:MAG: WG repeat-containing protein [Flavobacteriales bacterium]|nr:WG repeat-containing protein [Flavobacteriales bacterium]